jgi:predicted Zn-dependent peptidase
MFSCGSTKTEVSNANKTIEKATMDDINKMPESGEAPAIKFAKPKVFKLDNGLTVIVVENHKLPRVNVSFRMDNQPVMLRDKKGSDKLLGNLFGSGSQTVSKDEFNKEIDFFGANVLFFNDGYYINTLSKYFPKVLELTIDQTIHPKFTKEEFISEQEKLIEGLKTADKSTPDAAYRVMTKLGYGKHPYGEITTVDKVKKITLPDVENYYRRNYIPNHAYLIVVGDVNANNVYNLAQKYYADWKKAPEYKGTYIPRIENVAQTEVDFVHMPEAQQTEIRAIHRSDIRRNNPDYQKVLLMNSILGGDFNSYLNMTLREKHAWTYGARSNFGLDKYGDLFIARTSVRNQVADSAVVVILEQLNKIINEKVDDTLLNNNKQKYLGNFVLEMEKPSTIARQAYRIFVDNLPEDYYETFLKKIEQVTADDIQDVAKKYLHPNQMRIIVAGNARTTVPGLKKAGFKINYFDKYGNPVSAPQVNKKTPENISVKDIVERYIKAIGGKDKISKIKSVMTSYETQMQDMTLNNTIKKMAPNKFVNILSSKGMILNKEVFNGKTGYFEMSGHKKPMDEKDIKRFIDNPQPFSVLGLLKTGKLDRMDSFDGNDYYVVVEEDNTEYYFNAKTGLKDKEVSHQEVQGRQMTQTVKFSDYKEYSGIKFPAKITLVTGVKPLEFKLKEVKFNTLTDKDFQ